MMIKTQKPAFGSKFTKYLPKLIICALFFYINFFLMIHYPDLNPFKKLLRPWNNRINLSLEPRGKESNWFQFLELR